MLNNPDLALSGYHLSVNIFKCEGLPDVGSSCNAYCSVRCLSLVNTTPTIERNNSPTFNCKLVMPIINPILNDKIIVRIWDSSGLLIANVPEKPQESDQFNVS